VKIIFSTQASEDYDYWESHDSTIHERIKRLISEVKSDPYKGIGKPEPLKGDLTGWWSRRIDLEHRMVYRISGKNDDKILEISQLRFHY
jgi:toxin YoeB